MDGYTFQTKAYSDVVFHTDENILVHGTEEARNVTWDVLHHAELSF